MKEKIKFIKEWENSYKLLEIEEDADVLSYREKHAERNRPQTIIRHNRNKMGIGRRKKKIA